MTLYSNQFFGDAPEIQKFYYGFGRAREFQPQVCDTPFMTKHLRFEMNTRDVPDWKAW